MEFNELADRVTRDLPPGWEIRVELQQDSGDVVLEDPYCEDIDFPSNRETREQTVLDALEFAIENKLK